MEESSSETSLDNFSLRETDNEDENWEYYVERMKDQQEEDVQDEEEDEEPSVVNTDTTNLRAGDRDTLIGAYDSLMSLCCPNLLCPRRRYLFRNDERRKELIMGAAKRGGSEREGKVYTNQSELYIVGWPREPRETSAGIVGRRDGGDLRRGVGTRRDGSEKLGGEMRNASRLRQRIVHVRVDLNLNKQLRADVQKHNETVDRKMEVLKRLIDVTVFLGRQELAFQGHEEREGSSNWESVTELIVIEIKAQIRLTPFMALIIDETTDITNMSQLSSVLRYVASEENNEERFLSFTGVSTDRLAESLADHIFKLVGKYVCGDKLVSQTYDGTAVVSGVKHQNIICDGCMEHGIVGMRWKCVRCYDYDLCTHCYMADEHDLTHLFQRFETASSSGFVLGQKSSGACLENCAPMEAEIQMHSLRGTDACPVYRTGLVTYRWGTESGSGKVILRLRLTGLAGLHGHCFTASWAGDGRNACKSWSIRYGYWMLAECWPWRWGQNSRFVIRDGFCGWRVRSAERVAEAPLCLHLNFLFPNDNHSLRALDEDSPKATARPRPLPCPHAAALLLLGNHRQNFASDYPRLTLMPLQHSIPYPSGALELILNRPLPIRFQEIQCYITILSVLITRYNTHSVGLGIEGLHTAMKTLHSETPSDPGHKTTVDSYLLLFVKEGRDITAPLWATGKHIARVTMPVVRRFTALVL
ncbi:hypothetical protein PR048_008493 [Dryococelus australis]|uniref:ZZ-type domain-containing protein n=1 Tax=Dryococelus australis TaxID=614101 RepID=A0ABQ9HY26_9NEOP|nr:hypothetical protein PR048_008493 [Dryococelus australis]